MLRALGSDFPNATFRWHSAAAGANNGPTAERSETKRNILLYYGYYETECGELRPKLSAVGWMPNGEPNAERGFQLQRPVRLGDSVTAAENR